MLFLGLTFSLANAIEFLGIFNGNPKSYLPNYEIVYAFENASLKHKKTMSTFNLQKGIESNERNKPAPDSLILSIPRKPLVKPPQPVLYKEKPRMSR